MDLRKVAQEVAGLTEGAAERPVPGELYEARWPITYGPPAGERGEMLRLSRGQVFKLQGYPNDEKLVRLGYITKATKPIGSFACRACKATFTTERLRDKHGYEQHEEAKQKNPYAEQLYLRTQEFMSQGRTLNAQQAAEIKQLREQATAFEEQREAKPFREAAAETPLYLERSAASMR